MRASTKDCGPTCIQYRRSCAKAIRMPHTLRLQVVSSVFSLRVGRGRLGFTGRAAHIRRFYRGPKVPSAINCGWCRLLSSKSEGNLDLLLSPGGCLLNDSSSILIPSRETVMLQHKFSKARGYYHLQVHALKR